MAPGATIVIGDVAAGDVADQTADMPFLEGNEGIAVPVIDLGPAIVSLADGKRPHGPSPT
jgi:hypothetical protein